MEQDLSIITLVSQASIFVQAIMAILVLASLVSWYLIVQRAMYFNMAERERKRFESLFWSGTDLNTLYKQGSDSQTMAVGMESIFRAGFKEFTRMAQRNIDADAIMEGCQRAMRVAMNREEERLEQSLPFLATVGSTSPYIGLLGTVWGIMNSFQSIAISRNTSLAIVAPGIAEALFATALGLLAAIPAVVAYNKFNNDTIKYSQKLENFSKRFLTII